MSQNPKMRLASARLIVARRSPYFTATLLFLAPREAPGLGTVGVTNRGVLLYDPETIVAWSMDQLAGALVHEVLHVAYDHHRRSKGLDPALSNVAQDLAINDSVLAMGYVLPPGGLFPAQLGFPKNKVAEWYYNELLKGKPPEASKPCASGGWCGSCAGRPVPGEPEAASDPAARTEVEMARARRALAEEVRQASKQAGSVPDGLMRWADEALQPPKVRWQDKLARYARARCAASSAGSADYSYSRPNRRTLGWSGPKDPIRPSLHRRVPHVAVAVDTSGSMSGKELAEAMSEVRGVLSSVGVGVTFLSCDAAVNAVGKIRDWRQAASLLKGGGGTDFHPIFQAVRSLRPRPDVVVIATDGYGPAPGTEPLPTIWLLIGSNPATPVPWGQVVRVGDAA